MANENTEREIIRAAQAASFGADCDDALLAAAAAVYLRDYAPLANPGLADTKHARAYKAHLARVHLELLVVHIILPTLELCARKGIARWQEAEERFR